MTENKLKMSPSVFNKALTASKALTIHGALDFLNRWTERFEKSV